MKITRFLSIGLMLVLGMSFALAQGAPTQIEIALQDLNTRLGTQLTLDDLDNWTWAENIYPDASLGCPQEGQVYTQVTTRAYQFIFEYEDVTYDYRVLTDGSAFILCGTTTQTTTATPVVPTVAPAGTLPAVTATPVTGTCTMIGRFSVGETGRVTAGPLSNIRDAAGTTAADIGDVQAGEIFTVLAGPTCVESINWWQVQTATLTGWMAEGQNGLYFLEPIPQALPQQSAALTRDNAAQLTELSRIEGNFAGEMAWSETTLAVVYANPIQPGIWLYDVTALDTELPVLLSTSVVPTALEFSPDGLLLVVGYENGTVEFFSTEDNTSIFSASATNGAVQDLRFNAEGTILVTIGEDNTVQFWGVPAE